MLEVTGYL